MNRQPQIEPWNRLDPATAQLEPGETRHWLLVTEREIMELGDGYVSPRVKVQCAKALITLEQDLKRWAIERKETA